jgi:hypothetical protein
MGHPNLPLILADMGFWSNALSNLFGSLGAALILVLLYVLIQWFLAATDITIAYAWAFDGSLERPYNFRPSFDIRNRSRSKTYRLANIEYKLSGKLHAIDNHSIWGTELHPGSINFASNIAPVEGLTSFKDCTDVQVTVRLENGRMFWLQGQGMGQLQMPVAQKIAFYIRAKLERAAVPVE